MPEATDPALPLALELLRRFEAFRPDAYADPASKLAAWQRKNPRGSYPGPLSDGDPWTIGYGATGPGIAKGVVWTRAQAEEALAARAAPILARVRALVTRKGVPDAALSALVSLAYNIGCPAPPHPKACPNVDAQGFDCCTCRLRGSSALAKLNRGELRGAADAFLVWNTAGGSVNEGLMRRRTAERKVFAGACNLVV